MKHFINNNLNLINTEDYFVNSEKEKKLNVLSLFSGAGGMDLGFKGDFKFLKKYYEKLPYNLVFANDIFKQAADVYEYNFKHIVQRKSIDELIIPDDIVDCNVDIVLGGFPCQTFSYSGKRAGLQDPRGQLYLQMIRVIDYYQPKMFVAENVDGIRNSKNNIDGEKVDISALDRIMLDFESHGYNVTYKVLNASDYGVPQNRKRVIIMGLRKDIGTVDDIYYPFPLYNDIDRKKISAKDAIDDLWMKIDDKNYFNHSKKDYSKAKFYPGKKMQGNNQIKAHMPAPTIRAEHHGNIEAHYRSTLENVEDMAGWRRLSVRECARLQSFPDEFNFVTSASSAYKMIGNAVPPVLGWNIAKSVYYTLNKLGY